MRWWHWLGLGLLVGLAAAWGIQSRRVAAAVKASADAIAVQRDRSQATNATIDSLSRELEALGARADSATAARAAWRRADADARAAQLEARQLAAEATAAIGEARTLADTAAAWQRAAEAQQRRAETAEARIAPLEGQLAATGALLAVSRDSTRFAIAQRDALRRDRDGWQARAEQAQRAAESPRPRLWGIPLPSVTFGPGVSADAEGLQVKPLQLTLGYGL